LNDVDPPTKPILQGKQEVHIAVKGCTAVKLNQHVHVALWTSVAAGYRAKAAAIGPA
jgi:hypothetical protein